MKKQKRKSTPERETAELRHDHARRCKKAPDECTVCKGNMLWFAGLPAVMLSAVLEEY